VSRKRKIPLGSPVIIDTITSKYNLNNEANKDIAFMPEGIVTAYCNELSDQLIIRLRSRIEIKVSENELSECTKNYYFSDEKLSPSLVGSIEEFFKTDFVLKGNRKVKNLLNPFTFLRWIKFAIKDVL
tara:strand:- start:691 stop:1074 length:384 start_codon:yes stop_codon:yes gene_type:complete